MDERADLMREICVRKPTEKGDDAVLVTRWKRWRRICVVNGQWSWITGGVTSVSLYVLLLPTFAPLIEPGKQRVLMQKMQFQASDTESNRRLRRVPIFGLQSASGR
jgi:SH3-like domain-containing protein